MKIQTRLSLSCGTFSILYFVLPKGCGTAATDEKGRCKPVPAAQYVAATQDADGKAWAITVPSDAFSIKCSGGGAKGTASFVALVEDGNKNAKPGLTVRGNISGPNTLSVDENLSSTQTDSCGLAYFIVNWQCPPNQGDSIEGGFFVNSGALFSKLVSIKIEYPKPPDTVITPYPTSTSPSSSSSGSGSKLTADEEARPNLTGDAN